MSFTLPALPYHLNTLEPYISKETMEYHYGKHHQAYVNKLNELAAGTEYVNLSLEEIIQRAPKGPLLNNAAQVWNHAFYWQSLACHITQTQVSCPVREQIILSFGSFETFEETFRKAALQQFGSGWVWLVMNEEKQLLITSTSNADNPITQHAAGGPRHIPLLTCDVWEHAYYIDTRNDRGAYLERFWKIINWEFVEKNMESRTLWKCYQEG